MKYLLHSLLALVFFLCVDAGNLLAQTNSSKGGATTIQAAPVKNVPKLTMQEMTHRSEIIAVGKVSEVRSEWNNDKTRIVTHATLTIQEQLKGDPSQSSVVITYPGGEIGDVGELYSETAKFIANEEVVVFAKKDTQGNFRVLGGDQGKFSIAKNTSTSKNMVSPTTSLDELRTQIKSYVKAHENK